ncbi:hypothetical protein B0H14DRAFT_2972665, partial [Mycena olivaceomarginata]
MDEGVRYSASPGSDLVAARHGLIRQRRVRRTPSAERRRQPVLAAKRGECCATEDGTGVVVVVVVVAAATLSRPRIQDRAALRLAVLPSPVPCLAHIIRKLRRRRGPPPTSASACGTTRGCVLEVARVGTWMGWDAMRAPAAGVSRRRRGDTCMYERAPRALSPARGLRTPRSGAQEGHAPH